MENCLVTKLKSVVNNDNLEILGGVVVHAVSDANGKVLLTSVSQSRLISVYAPDVTIIGADGGIRIDAHNAKVRYSFTISESNKAFDFVLTDKYNLGSFILSNAAYTDNIHFLKAVSDLFEFGISISSNTPRPSIDFDDIPVDSLKRITITATEKYKMVINGTLNGLINRCDISLMTKVVCKINAIIEPNTDITTLFGSATSITTLGFFDCTNMTGTVESFVAAQVNAGRATCTISITDGGKLGAVTFNGGAFTGISGTTSTLKWRPTTSSVEGAVTDVMVNNTAIIIDADGNKVGDTTTW